MLLFLYMVMTSYVMNVTLTNSYFHFHLEEGPTAFANIVYADAPKPFVYRALAPFLVRSLTYLTPQSAKLEIENVVRSKDILQIFGFKMNYATEYFWAFIILYLSVLGFAFIMRKFVTAFYRSPSFLADFAPVAALVCLPLLGSYFIYDYPNLLIFTTCLLFLIKNDLRLFYPVFIVACFSKETSVLIPFILLLNISRYQNRKVFWFNLIAQSLIWVTIFGLLRYVFKDNPGQFLEIHLLGHNLAHLTNPANLFRFTANVLPKGLNIFLVASLVILTAMYWKSKPVFLRRSLFILVPMLGLALIFGWIEETRMYIESLPICFTLCLHSTLKIFKIPYEQSIEKTVLRPNRDET